MIKDDCIGDPEQFYLKDWRFDTKAVYLEYLFL